MTKKIIHVNQNHIRYNAKNGAIKPVFTIKEGRKLNIYTNDVRIHCDCGKEIVKLVYNGRQLSCGARVWIEVDADVIAKNPMTFQEIKEICESKLNV